MTANVFISGFVQGVGFRQFVKRTAREFFLKGWVKNLADGRVEAEFYGEKDVIEKTIDKLWKGTFLSEVKNIDIEWLDGEKESEEFIILRD
ncbi:MAG: acylphosphatase [Patescibacteria group bacterium]